MAISSSVLSFISILAVIFIAPLIAHRVKLPTMVLEVMVGIFLGQSFLRLIKADPWLDFFSFFGLIYLLFLAGLEIDFHDYAKTIIPIVCIASASLLLPFTIGFHLGRVTAISPIFLGTLLSTTSVGVVIPLAKELGNSRFTTILLGSTMLVDVASMFLLTFSIEVSVSSQMPGIPWSYMVVILLMIIPLIMRRFSIGKVLEFWSGDKTHFQFEVRACFAMIAAFVLLSEIIGFHAILGAFMAGLIVSELTHKGGELDKKLQGFGYGFFTPFFFTIVGATTDIPSLLQGSIGLWFLALVLLLGLGSKVAGVGLMGFLFKLNKRESLSMGFIKSSRLSLILAGATIGKNLGIINLAVYSSLVVFALLTVIIGPTIGMFILTKKSEPIEYYPDIPEEFGRM